jgi:hypothetical protein
MAPSKPFSERLDEQIERLEKLEVGKAQRTVVSVIKKLVELKERLIFLEENKGIKRVRMSKTGADKRPPSPYQQFVIEMSSKLIKKFPEFTARSKEIGRLWSLRKAGSDVSESDFDSDDSEEIRVPSVKKPKAKAKAKKTTPKKKAVKKGGFYDEAYSFNYF